MNYMRHYSLFIKERVDEKNFITIFIGTSCFYMPGAQRICGIQ